MTQSLVACRSSSDRRWSVLAVVACGQFLFVVYAFIVNLAIPAIRADLGATPSETAAVLALYQVGYAALVIAGGRLGDIYGRRRLFVGGVLAFSAASLGCGLAPSGLALVGARLAQGAAAALLVPQVLAVIHTLFPDPAARGRAFGAFGVALGLGGTAAFLLGGALVSLDLGGLGWRTVFLWEVPFGLGLAWVGARLVPAGAPAPGASLDGSGAAMLAASLLALIGPITAGHQFGWPWWLGAPVLAGAALLALFVRRAGRLARAGCSPLIEPALLRDRRFARGLCAVSAFQFGNTSFYLLVTLLMQDRLSLTPIAGGLALLPLGIAFTLASYFAGRHAARLRMTGLQGGNAVQLAGIMGVAWLAWSVSAPDTAVLVAVLTVFGFGQGAVMAPLSGAVLSTVHHAHAGAASGLLNTVQQAASAVGVSVIGSVYAAAGGGRAGLLEGLAMLCLSTVLTATLLLWTGRARGSA